MRTRGGADVVEHDAAQGREVEVDGQVGQLDGGEPARAVRLRQPAATRDRVQHATVPSQAHRDVDHGEAGADEEHIAVIVDRGERTRRPRVGDEPVGGEQGRRGPSGAGRQDPWREDDVVDDDRGAVGQPGFVVRMQRGRRTRLERHGALPAAQQAGAPGVGDLVVEGVAQIGAVRAAREEVVGSGVA